MKLAVVGRGMIGSAATRHLAEAGFDVTLFGRGEPADYSSHKGVFSSHYDESRITRGLDPDPFWSNASTASIARYRPLETQTGIKFFREVGVLMTGPNDTSPINDVLSVAQDAGIACDVLGDETLAERFSYFAFETGSMGVFERANAGYINPRAMVQAQLLAAKMAGAKFVDTDVDALDEIAAGIAVRTKDDSFQFDRVLVATGGFTNLLLANEVPLTIYARTVAMFQIGDTEQARLLGMPSHIALQRDGRDPYLLPPMKYPDGKTHLKLGGDPVDVILANSQDTKDWFRSGGSEAVGDFLEASIRAKIPDLAIEVRNIRPCVTCFTDDELPVIKCLTSRISVAVGGNGKGAKNSDELGWLGAETLTGQLLPST
ncbi:MAG: FAD-dependent oxidoreductase [Paracoccaceae bacterium]|nr:FAD-dependent oxidoreductase [Paracoccaceae bacterium]